jgi:hypothetical protein
MLVIFFMFMGSSAQQPITPVTPATQVLPTLSRDNIVPTCWHTDPVFRNNEWSCDYYKLDPTLYPDQPNYAHNNTYATDDDMRAACAGMGTDCMWGRVNFGKLAYTGEGPNFNNVTTGYRVMPTELSMYKRFFNNDNSVSFYTPTSVTADVGSLEDCETIGLENDAYGYVYNGNNKNCNTYSLSTSSSAATRTDKFLKDLAFMQIQ